VVIPPLPPRAKPQVTIGSGTAVLTVEGTVLPPGSSILLPPEATGLVKGTWQRLKTLPVEIRADGSAIRGSVSLDELGMATQKLLAACAER
jgi:hypothetical protein